MLVAHFVDERGLVNLLDHVGGLCLVAPRIGPALFLENVSKELGPGIWLRDLAIYLAVGIAHYDT